MKCKKIKEGWSHWRSFPSHFRETGSSRDRFAYSGLQGTRLIHLFFRGVFRSFSQSDVEIQAVIDPIYEQLLAQLPASLESIVTKSLIERAVALAEVPAVKFPISGLLVMEDGKLVVIHEQDNLTSVDRADLFSPRGKFLGSFAHPRQGLRNMVFENGKAYTIEVDEGDNKYLVRYNIELVDS